MHLYRERLSAPFSWWLGGMITMVPYGFLIWTGENLLITSLVFAFLIAVTAAFLINWGRARIEVSPGELRAGDSTLPLATAGEVRALDEAQARALRGPRADPSAHVLIRPYLKYAVYVQVTSPSSPAPYWLIMTRHPVDLAAAIERSRPVVSPGGKTMA
jgi:Protein of unknown function (DUF3093)